MKKNKLSKFDQKIMVESAINRLRSRGEVINSLDIIWTNHQYMFSKDSNLGDMVKQELNIMMSEERDKKINEILIY